MDAVGAGVPVLGAGGIGRSWMVPELWGIGTPKATSTR